MRSPRACVESREFDKPPGGNAPPAVPAGGWESVDILEGISGGVFTVDGSGGVVAISATGTDLLFATESAPPDRVVSCCELVCSRVIDTDRVNSHVCLTDEVLETATVTPEMQMFLPGTGDAPRLAWVTASPLGSHPGAVFHVAVGHSDMPRGEPPSHSPGARLRVFAFGRTRVESSATGSMTGLWLDQRPGQLFKYLICARDRIVTADELAQALSPTDTRASSSVRYLVHVLRAKLEPSRRSRDESRFIESSKGGYALNRSLVWIDATEFERLAAAGLATLVAGDRESAARLLESAANLYRGDFLADEPYAVWALTERDRLQDLAAKALRALVELSLMDDQLEAAARHARRLADLEPFDNDAQRRHIEVSLRRGRRTEAVRRYKLFKQRLAKDFDAEPDFTLADLEGPEAGPR